jgi:hypothetical protein
MKTILILTILNLLFASCLVINKPTAKVYSDDEIYTAFDKEGNVIDENYCLDSLNLTGYRVKICNN